MVTQIHEWGRKVGISFPSGTAYKATPHCYSTQINPEAGGSIFNRDVGRNLQSHKMNTHVTMIVECVNWSDIFPGNMEILKEHNPLPTFCHNFNMDNTEIEPRFNQWGVKVWPLALRILTWRFIMEDATETVNGLSYTLHICTVRIFLLAHLELTAQWIWSSPLTEIRTVVCVWVTAEA